MTFQTFKRFVLMSVFFMTTSVVIYAQQFTMQGLIGQSLAKLQQPTSESILNPHCSHSLCNSLISNIRIF